MEEHCCSGGERRGQGQMPSTYCCFSSLSGPLVLLTPVSSRWHTDLFRASYGQRNNMDHSKMVSFGNLPRSFFCNCALILISHVLPFIWVTFTFLSQHCVVLLVNNASSKDNYWFCAREAHYCHVFPWACMGRDRRHCLDSGNKKLLLGLYRRADLLLTITVSHSEREWRAEDKDPWRDYAAVLWQENRGHSQL